MLELFKFITQVKAQSGGTLPLITDPVPPPSHFDDPITGGLVGIVNEIGVRVVDAAGILALIALIYSGIMYMTAGGDEAKAEKAKKNLMWAIIGVLITLMAFIIIRWINNITTI